MRYITLRLTTTIKSLYHQKSILICWLLDLIGFTIKSTSNMTTQSSLRTPKMRGSVSGIRIMGLRLHDAHIATSPYMQFRQEVDKRCIDFFNVPQVIVVGSWNRSRHHYPLFAIKCYVAVNTCFSVLLQLFLDFLGQYQWSDAPTSRAKERKSQSLARVIH